MNNPKNNDVKIKVDKSVRGKPNNTFELGEANLFEQTMGSTLAEIDYHSENAELLRAMAQGSEYDLKEASLLAQSAGITLADVIDGTVLDNEAIAERR
jgi:hypothetical protein